MKKINFILPLVLLGHLLLLILLRFTGWPEITLWPYLLLKGWLPYRDIAMAHSPLLIFDLAIFYKLFGVSLLGLKIYTWLVIILTDLFIYLVAKRITKNNGIALLSLAFYVLWQPFFEGNGLWFDLALAPAALLIFYFLWQKKFFWAGIMLGTAVLVKQTAVWYIVPLIGQIWLMGQLRFKSILRLGAGVVIPLLAIVYWLVATNTLSDFYFWAVKFAIFYLPKAPGQVELPTLKQVLGLVVPFGLILPAMFLKKERKLILILLVWFVFGSLGVYPRWSLFHFQPALPFLAIISGLIIVASVRGATNFFEESHSESYAKNISSLTSGLIPNKKFRGDLSTRMLFIFFVLIIFGTLYFQFRFYKLNLRAGDRFFEPSTEVMAFWLKGNTKPNERVFIFNTWDNLYAFSDTLPAARPWVPTLSWYLEFPGIQEKMVADLQNNKPSLIVFEPYKNTGLGSYQPKQIDKFIKANYTLKEIIGDRFWVMEAR